MRDYTDKDIEALVSAVLRHDSPAPSGSQREAARERLLSRAALQAASCKPMPAPSTRWQRLCIAVSALAGWIGSALGEDAHYDRVRSQRFMMPIYAFAATPSAARYFYQRPVLC